MTGSGNSGGFRRAVGRREFVGRSLAAGAFIAGSGQTAGALQKLALLPTDRSPFGGVTQQDGLFEKTIAELRAEMERGSLTSRALTLRYLDRVDAMDKSGPAINAVIEQNPDALATADQRDAERRAGRVRGPLHGIPVLIKDNIDSADRMRTSAGSLALAESTPSRDAFIVERLREAGAILLGKTNLSEWANFRSTHSTSGWSGRGGLTRNPYVLDRNPCGSSSGTGAAIAADFATIGIGTETDGSIICPSAICGLVGIKPTVGLWSRSGIIPISASQDTAGPMARTVTDAAVLLGALTGVDPRDPATRASTGKSRTDYSRGLDAGGLKGIRVGVARNLAGFSAQVDAVLERAVTALREAGAVVVDKTDLLTAGKFDDAETIVLDYEFKAGLNAYLATLGISARVKTLAELIAWNEREKTREMAWFGQEVFIRAQQRGPLSDKKYIDARAKCIRLARAEGIDAVMTAHRLDAIVCPSNQPAWTTDLLNGDHFTGGNTSFAAVAGYPSVTVPMGFVHELPVGLSFVGRAWSEGALVKYAYAFELQTKARRAPRYLPTSAA